MKKPWWGSNDLLSLFFIGLSLIGLTVLAVSTFTASISIINFDMQKQLIGSIFASICILGIILGIFPSRCSRILHFRTKSDKKEQNESETTTIGFVGHHPICGNFSAHILRFGSKTYCAGCTGLVLGAIISLLGISSYSFLDYDFGGNAALVFWVGFIAVVCGLLQYHLPDGNMGSIHLLFNVTFVLGALFLLIGIHEITRNFILEVYSLVLIVYWIMARIMTSQMKHRKICETCSLKSCSYV